MARKKSVVPPYRPVPTYVTFDFEQRTYQIDANHNKVYRRFVEIETSKASQILSMWRSRPLTA